MSLMITAMLLEKYGPRLSTRDLGDVLKINYRTIENKIYRGELGIVTYRDQGKVWADCRDVAEYLDECRSRAKAEATQA
jgi:hypothetical protein